LRISYLLPHGLLERQVFAGYLSPVLIGGLLVDAGEDGDGLPGCLQEIEVEDGELAEDEGFAAVLQEVQGELHDVA
jgi:hypothetical protein